MQLHVVIHGCDKRLLTRVFLYINHKVNNGLIQTSSCGGAAVIYSTILIGIANQNLLFHTLIMQWKPNYGWHSRITAWSRERLNGSQCPTGTINTSLARSTQWHPMMILMATPERQSNPYGFSFSCSPTGSNGIAIGGRSIVVSILTQHPHTVTYTRVRRSYSSVIFVLI